MTHTVRRAIALLPLALPYACCGLLRHVVSLETLVRLAWRRPVPAAPNALPPDAAVVQALAHDVSTISRVVGAAADCLPCSLVIYSRLSKWGADPRLTIGFSHAAPSLVGHAWVVVDGEAINEPPDMLATLTPVCVFGPEGRPLRSA